MMLSGVAGGMPSAEVAEKVFAAIENEQFYVFPHPEFLPFVRARMEKILEQKNPELLGAFPEAQQVALPAEEKERG
jgi:hypothetical protein